MPTAPRELANNTRLDRRVSSSLLNVYLLFDLPRFGGSLKVGSLHRVHAFAHMDRAFIRLEVWGQEDLSVRPLTC